MRSAPDIETQAIAKIIAWKEDWNLFAKEALGANLDPEQQAIVSSAQYNPRTSVASGTARGKDFVAAVIALCFMYLTPVWNEAGELVENTKVAMTAPTEPQVKNIMMPEISRLWNRAQRNGVNLPGRLNAMDIRTDNKEWFLVGFKSDNNNTESWSGFHAVNTMFIVTEASGISQTIFDAIEGNLQGNSRILIVFNPNSSVGYAAQSQKGERWSKFRLNSLTAPNILQKKKVIPGQVDYEWVKDKLTYWCTPLGDEKPKLEEDDFQFEGEWYRPNDLFRIKVLGKFPKVAEDVLIPQSWLELAQQRWKDFKDKPIGEPKLGVDVAGMGRDSSVLCPRYDNYVAPFIKMQSAGQADHMAVVGKTVTYLKQHGGVALIDTIGEGAGVFSRMQELEDYKDKAISCKYSEAAKDSNEKELTDITEQYKFANMRAFLFWAVRDWLNPANETGAMVPPSTTLLEEAIEIKWKFRSDGKVIIEPKEDIKKRLGRSTDEFDALANTFYPVSNYKIDFKKVLSAFRR